MVVIRLSRGGSKARPFFNIVVTDKRVEPEEHKKFVAAEIAKWGPAIKAAGQYAD